MRRVLALLLITGLISTLYAQDIGLKSITPKAGIMSPENWDTGFYIGADVNLGQIAENITLVPFLEYWSAGKDIGSVSFDFSNIKLGAAGHYDITDVPGLYVGAGLALNFVTLESPTITNIFLGTTGTTSSTETKFGAVILSGYRIPLGQMKGVIEAQYNLMSWNTFQLGFGVEFDM